MKIWKMVVHAALILLFAGCSDSVDQPGATPWAPSTTQAPGDRWADKITTGDGGAVAAPGFNTHIDATAPAWAESADSTLAELLGLTRQFDGPISVLLRRENGADNPVLTATLTKLGDDSVNAMRYRIVLRRADDGRFRFVEGKLTTRCQTGRGHQTFETTRCS
ncbi:hypothetical protein [Dactylosporangium sp. NPDC005555]|uniref:hypothetical protein n=1 Tax=Dactylosporangium sp. NPDC005555 TaxID=3154889 RepID=UPI0033BA81DA